MIALSTIGRPSCQDCRRWLLNSFIALAGTERAVSTRSLPSARRLYHKKTALRIASSYASRPAAVRSPSSALPLLRSQRLSIHTPLYKETEFRGLDSALDDGEELIEIKPESRVEAAADVVVTAAEESSESYVPWYLQRKSDVPSSTQHTAGGQEAPAIPEYAPELLEPIVKHVLETLGLTCLRILDLREMTDPPPALGANLLMVVATARSERHLHASADRLCRWLRTEYKLTPFADGLLGRNEMKIAIRRRTRRAKMMSAVGAKSADSGDIADGLRSEWICVNVGRVDGGVLPELEKAQAEKEVVGFGTAYNSSTIVVQMMTESKREEIDIEGLWESALKRHRRQQQDMANGITAEEAEEEPTWSQPTAQIGHGPVSTTSYNPFKDMSERPTA